MALHASTDLRRRIGMDFQIDGLHAGESGCGANPLLPGDILPNICL